MSVSMSVRTFCRPRGYRVDDGAWQIVFERLSIPGEVSDYAPGGRFAHHVELAASAEAAAFRASPEGGCLLSMDWAQRWFPDLAARLISPPKTY